MKRFVPAICATIIKTEFKPQPVTVPEDHAPTIIILPVVRIKAEPLLPGGRRRRRRRRVRTEDKDIA